MHADKNNFFLSWYYRRESKKQELGKSYYPKPLEQPITNQHQKLTSEEVSQEGQVIIGDLVQFGSSFGVCFVGKCLS